MSRIARIVLEGVPYHVTQRGNGRQQVFFEDRDYELYSGLLARGCAQAGLVVWAYCLMPNHVHLIVVPERRSAMPQALGRVHADYAKYYNLKRRTCGHVWQARYFSTPLDGVHLWQAMAYVERNPVRARMVGGAEAYPWSSARMRRDGSGNGLIDLERWRESYDWPRWRAALAGSIDEEAFGVRLREASRRGRPLGGEEFTDQLEERSGRKLRARPVGRPKETERDERDQMAFGFGV